MKKTFITKIPDKPGSFLKPVKVISELGLNITRVSYNNAIDTNILFIEVDGDHRIIEKCYEVLKNDGFLFKENKANVILMEFKLPDKPNTLLPILELINEYNFNISYISSQENNTPYQLFKMALYIDEPEKIDLFLKSMTGKCDVRIINYDKTEKTLDNTVFYISFASELASKLELSNDLVNDLIENSNLVMQLLDEKNLSPYKTFEYIAQFGECIAKHRGIEFKPRISQRDFADFSLYCIEPPCGSNIYIIEKNNNLLFVDSGFAIYKNETISLLKIWFDSFDSMKKYNVITHPDIDHCGLLDIFNKIYVGKKAYDNFFLELSNKPNFREQYKAHEPYVKISKILSKYNPPALERLVIIDNGNEGLLEYLGSFEFEGLKFDLFNGNGGHSTGEVVIKLNDIWFTGDILVNPDEYTPEQKEFNRLAPYLMTSVNMNSEMSKAERIALSKQIKENDIICFGHGKPKW